MMDDATRRELLQRIQELEDDAKSLLRRIEREHGGDFREHRKEVETRARLHFGALEDKLYLSDGDREADEHQQATSATRRKTMDLLERLVEVEQDERDATRRLQTLEHEGRVIRAKQLADEVAANKAFVGRVFPGSL